MKGTVSLLVACECCSSDFACLVRSSTHPVLTTESRALRMLQKQHTSVKRASDALYRTSLYPGPESYESSTSRHSCPRFVWSCSPMKGGHANLTKTTRSSTAIDAKTEIDTGGIDPKKKKSVSIHDVSHTYFEFVWRCADFTWQEIEGIPERLLRMYNVGRRVAPSGVLDGSVTMNGLAARSVCYIAK